VEFAVVADPVVRKIWGRFHMTGAHAADAALDRLNVRSHAINLFLVGFLILFFELTCIRWFASYVVFLQFFTNVVLIASFLGMSCGCLASRRHLTWLEYFPAIAVGTVLAAFVFCLIYNLWSGLAIDVGGQRSAQEVFFGTERRNLDAAQFVVPIEAIAAAFFLLIALMFVGLGQVLGRAFDAYPNRVLGYTLNIGGSLAGIVGFSALAFLQVGPGVWFLISCCGVAYLLYQANSLTRVRAFALITLVAAVTVQGGWFNRGIDDRRWSPYYLIDHNIKSGSINVNTIGHQAMLPFSSTGSMYSLIHLLQQHSGGKPFRDVLVIGAGSGNDVAHALRFGAGRIDAVEIDPVIQDIGRRYHPDHPYQDPRVVAHLDDGRHFLRTTDRKYDLVVYALVDSLILHSSYANLRLESYLFTKEAFADIRRVLKPNGLFVTYNFFRQGWIVERIATMAMRTFGCRPLVINLPYQQYVTESVLDAFTMVVSGCNSPIPAAFARHSNFWLHAVPTRNLTIDGFAVNPAMLPADQAGSFARISPATVTYRPDTMVTSDDWPFLYLRGQLIPNFTMRSIVILGIVGLGMVYFFLPSGGIFLDNRMFFLGVAFMLLETRAVTQMALLFGSTWLVNSSVFATILILILVANIYVLVTRGTGVIWQYVGLFICLAIGAAIPPDLFLAGGMLWRYLVPGIIALSPVFFAGVIFARTFSNAAHPELAFGSNVAGAVVGGLAEALSTVLGFQHLLIIALLCYALSAWSPRMRLAFSRL
jgi:SAM-dependent methyltransferase